VHPDVKRIADADARADGRRPHHLATPPPWHSMLSVRATDAKARSDAAARGALLTPIAKAFFPPTSATRVTSLGVQVHGGMGFIEETGAAQHYRDARITAIYEGTNGIQSIDLVTRKLAAQDGASVWALLDELSDIVKRVEASNDPPSALQAQTARRAGLAGNAPANGCWSALLGAERSAGGSDAISATVRIDARRLQARGGSLAARTLGEGFGDPQALCHAGAVLCRKHLGAGRRPGAHGDGRCRCGHRRRRDSAGVVSCPGRDAISAVYAVFDAVWRSSSRVNL